MKIAVIFGDGLPSKLTMGLTGCAAYHVGFVDEKTDKFYDMHLIRRRRLWSRYAEKREYLLFDAAEVTAEHLEHMLDTSNDSYGFLDYCMFALRPVFHLFGKSTRNMGGVICSEMVNLDVRNCGGATPWAVEDEPPSPCDWYMFLKSKEL